VKFGNLTLTPANVDSHLIFRMDYPLGFHSFPATQLLRVAQQQPAAIRLHILDGNSIDLKDPFDILILAIPQGALAVISFEGEGAEQARTALENKITELYQSDRHELGPLLTLEELAEEFRTRGMAEPQRPTPAPVPAEEIPAGFLRAQTSGILSRIAQGKALVVNLNELITENQNTPPASDEVDRFNQAAEMVSHRYRAAADESDKPGGEDPNERNLTLLGGMVNGVRKIIEEKKLGTAAAVHKYMKRLKKHQAENPKLIEDMQAVANDVVLTRYTMIEEVIRKIDAAHTGKAILVLDTVTPIIALHIAANKRKIGGVICENNISRESHQVILLDGAGIPIVAGIDRVISGIKNETQIVLDSGEKVVIADQQADGAAPYTKLRLAEQNALDEIILNPTIEHIVRTADGTEIRLHINAENPEELRGRAFPAVGLWRSEFELIKHADGSLREKEPSEEELVAIYANVLRLCAGKPFIFRTFDFEGSKFPRYIGRKMVADAIRHENGPEGYLLYDGAAETLEFKLLQDLFRKQIRAFLIATGIVEREGRLTNAPGIMFPSISSDAKLSKAQNILCEEQRKLRTEGKPFCADTRSGSMIESISAVRDIKDIADLTEFFSIGTNDLKAAFLAHLGYRDARKVAQTIVGIPPDLLQYFDQITQAAAKHKRPVSCCGVLASDPRYVPLLIGAGITGLSVTPSQLPIIAHLISKITYEDARKLFLEAKDVGNVEAVDEILDRETLTLMEGAWAGLKPLSYLIFRNRKIKDIIEAGERMAA
jgi:phosphotransferase system enzyme I (PtsI)